MSGKTKTENQSQKFKRLAREVEADEDERAFEEKLKGIAEAGPQTPPKPKKETPDK